jgi:hypothetical protein
MNTPLLSLDESSKTLNRVDMSWFYNEFSDVVLRRTSIRRSPNQSCVPEHLLTNRLSLGCEPPGLGGKGELYFYLRKLAEYLRCLVPYDRAMLELPS